MQEITHRGKAASGPPLVAKKFDVQAVAEAVAGTAADFHQPAAALPQFLHGTAFRHEEHAVRGDGAVQGGKKALDFQEVRLRGDHELELIVPAVVQPCAQHFRLETAAFMALDPPGFYLSRQRRGMSELGAEAREIAGDAARQDGPRRFQW